MSNKLNMQSQSHKTTIAILLEAIERWRKSNGWSRETVIDEVVTAHVKAGFDVPTGIVFDPNTKDTYSRMKVNADRVYRWLDDYSTDKNLLPANFINSLLLALPMDLRIATANQLTMPIGLSCTSLNTDGSNNTFELLQSIIQESAEAQQSIVALLDGETAEELHAAHKEISEAIAKLEQAKNMVETKIVDLNIDSNLEGKPK